MTDALRQIVVPRLRDAGFKGSFPHFRRASAQQIDLLTFQFDKWGGGFIIEISSCAPEGFTTHWGLHISPNKVRASDIHPDHRVRLRPREGSSTADWFRFDQPASDPRKSIFPETAESVIPHLERAEAWWKSSASHAQRESSRGLTNRCS